NRLERNDLSVQNCGFVFVLSDDGPVEVDPSEKTTGPRIGKHLRFHFPICISSCLASPRPRRAGCFGANFELVRQQMVHATLIHDQHDQIDGLTSELKTPASSRNSYRRWRTPAISLTVRSPARSNSFSVPTAKTHGDV